MQPETAPLDVLRLMVTSGQHAVALKYVHKFNAMEHFPPAQLIARCLEEGVQPGGANGAVGEVKRAQ